MDDTLGSCAEAEPFALQVLGDSMEPEFTNGVIVIIDPSAKLEDGSYVIAEYQDELIFRQLRLEGDRVLLKALNEQYPVLTLEAGLIAVKGVVVQQAGKRRKDRKFYS